MTAIDHVVVVVPAHDEEELVVAALDALAVAAAAIAPEVRTTVVVVANACSDRTAPRASAAGATVLEVSHANVGAARADGFAWALEHAVDPGERAWFATTDADSRVPAAWLSAQLAAAASGGDVYLGTVALEPDDVASFSAWAETYAAASRRQSGHGHGHVHGASMGMGAESYRRVGGFAPLDHDEDVDLVIRLTAAGARLVWDESCPVVTSSRLEARAPLGVARDLARSLDPGGMPA